MTEPDVPPELVSEDRPLVPTEPAPPPLDAATEAELAAWQPKPNVLARPLDEREGFRRLERMRQFMRRPGVAAPPASTAGEAEKREREMREAEVTEAARRSQAEIRRHVDAYLKEHFEGIVTDVANVVVEHVHDRLMKGIAGLQENQAIRLDQIAADMRAQLRAFIRDAWAGKPVAKPAQRAPKGRARAKR
ncbi:MAG TPA: hypothetical protein VE987_14715 [Polyangiaceae bacterium]|nr:hypothetical protein [Polyangiaceae bacterium]